MAATASRNPTASRDQASQNPDLKPTGTASPPKASKHDKGFAALRIGFGVIWAIDAAYKWVPAFRTETLVKQFSRHLAKVHTPIVHAWIDFWYRVAKGHQNPFGYTVAVVETLVALGLLFGCFSKATFVVGGLLSAGIWTAAEGAGLPITAGQTDIGTSIIYVLVFVALFLAAAGSTWSLDERLRGRAGKLARLMD